MGTAAGFPVALCAVSGGLQLAGPSLPGGCPVVKKASSSAGALGIGTEFPGERSHTGEGLAQCRTVGRGTKVLGERGSTIKGRNIATNRKRVAQAATTTKVRAFGLHRVVVIGVSGMVRRGRYDLVVLDIGNIFFVFQNLGVVKRLVIKTEENFGLDVATFQRLDTLQAVRVLG
jgi:hypothetical protein